MTLLAASQTWRTAENILGHTVPGTVDDEAKVPVGTIRRFVDANYGMAEFIYLKGVASTVAGDAVTYSTGSFTTTRAVAGAGVPMALAWASAAIVANKFGWYQISGVVVANKTKTVSMAAGIAVAIATTALVIHSSSLKEIEGAYVAVVASATTTTLYGDKVQLNISRPRLQGRIT